MKNLFIISALFVSFSTLAAKPRLLLRYSDVDSWNLPLGHTCFNNTPSSFNNEIFIRCSDGDSDKIFMIANNRTEEILKSRSGYLFSDPTATMDGILWSEYAEGGTVGIFKYSDNQMKKIAFKPSGLIDGLTQIEKDSYIFRWRDWDGQQHLENWKTTLQTWNDHTERSFAFAPVGAKGQLAYKLRLQSLNERSPDMIYWWKDLSSAPLVLKDKDADATSVWTSFRNMVSLSGSSLIFVGSKEKSEALAMMNLEGKVQVLAETGVDLKEIDYFSPSANKQQMVLFRGIDKQGLKTLYFWNKGKLTHLLKQGDVIKTDKGSARVDYEDPQAIFMSSAYIDESRAMIQVALVDIDHRDTLIGVGLVEISLK